MAWETAVKDYSLQKGGFDDAVCRLCCTDTFKHDKHGFISPLSALKYSQFCSISLNTLSSQPLKEHFRDMKSVNSQKYPSCLICCSRRPSQSSPDCSVPSTRWCVYTRMHIHSRHLFSLWVSLILLFMTTIIYIQQQIYIYNMYIYWSSKNCLELNCQKEKLDFPCSSLALESNWFNYCISGGEQM